MILLVISGAHTSYATTIGSDSVVTRIGFQQPLITGDRVAGATVLEAGFKMADVNTNALWDSFFQITGIADWNCGTLTLFKDLTFSDTSGAIRNLGNIVGNGHTMSLAPTMSCIPDVISTSTVVPTGGGSCNASLTFATDLPTAKDYYSVDWSYDSAFVVGGIRDNPDQFNIWQWNNASLTPVANIVFTGAQNTILQATRWHPSQFFLAVGILSNNYTDSNGATVNEIAIYQFNPFTSATTLVSSVALAATVGAVSLSWSPNGNFLVVAQVTQAGNNATQTQLVSYPVNGSGIIGAAASTVTIPQTGNRVITSSSTGHTASVSFHATGGFVVAGVATDSTNPQVYVYVYSQITGLFTAGPDATATVRATNGTSTLAASVNGVSWNKTFTNVIAVGNTSNNPLQLWSYSPGSLTYLTPPINSPLTTNVVYALNWRSDGTCLATADAMGDTTVYTFNNITNVLTQNFLGAQGGIMLDVRYSPNLGYLAADNHNHFIYIYIAGNSISGTCSNNCGIISNLVIEMSANMCLQQCLTFSGVCFIKGYDKCLTLAPHATIFIAPNSSLAFEDVILREITAGDIVCLDNSGTITLQNTTWEMDGNYTFSLGILDIVGDVHMVGEDTIFAYQSSQQCTIEKSSQLILDKAVTFSYAPSTASRDLLKFVDIDSKLVLNNATLFSTTTGIRLTHGELLVNGHSYLTSDATVPSQGITFGDGVSSSQNFIVHWSPASVLELTRGFVNYSNIGS